MRRVIFFSFLARLKLILLKINLLQKKILENNLAKLILNEQYPASSLLFDFTG